MISYVISRTQQLTRRWNHSCPQI